MFLYLPTDHTAMGECGQCVCRWLHLQWHWADVDITISPDQWASTRLHLNWLGCMLCNWQGKGQCGGAARVMQWGKTKTSILPLISAQQMKSHQKYARGGNNGINKEIKLCAKLIPFAVNKTSAFPIHLNSESFKQLFMYGSMGKCCC